MLKVILHDESRLLSTAIRTNHRLFIVSYLTLVIDLLEAHEWDTINKNVSYLFIANGWFGRLALSLDWDFGFNELMDLSQVAQKVRT